MDRLTENKIILVKRSTRLEELIRRFNTIEQAKFYIEHMGADFSDYLNEHKVYEKALKNVEINLASLGRLHTIDRSYLPTFIFDKKDIVVVLGQDGLVVNTAKYLESQPIIAINPDPKRWDGVLLPFKEKDVKKIVPEVFAQKRKTRLVTMAKAELNDGQVLYGVNDLFIGQKTHVSARYSIKQGNIEEQQSSSGIIVSTGLGSTGWLKSVITGASNIYYGWSGDEIQSKKKIALPWDSNYLIYSVREPFPSKTTSTKLVFGNISKKNYLIITSLMPENGVIFSDGVENDFLEFHSGSIATIKVAEKKAHIVV